MLSDLIISVDFLSISLGMGLSITLKAGVKMPGWLWGTVAQWPEHLWLKHGWLTNVDGMKDLWCSSTVRLLSTQI